MLREVKLNRTKTLSVKEQIENMKESYHLKGFHESLIKGENRKEIKDILKSDESLKLMWDLVCPECFRSLELHEECQLEDEMECEYCGKDFISSEADYKKVYMKV